VPAIVTNTPSTSSPLTLGTDPRTDPRIVAVLARYGLADDVPRPPVSLTAALSARRDFCARAESELESLLSALISDLPPIAEATRETITIPAHDGEPLTLHVHRPRTGETPLPCVVQLHGGGMVMLRAADPTYLRWRDALAATGIVVVGVEFRNAAGLLGPHPFPTGLDDCTTATQWTAAHLRDLGASHLIVSGDSGGGNLTLALAHRARRDGWLNLIAGCYAQCPFISGAWDAPPADLRSLYDFDGYFATRAVYSLFKSVYDPGAGNEHDPTCWPLAAQLEDLAGLPPHVISVNELDLLRDEGLMYYRRLCQAGVPAVGRVLTGTCHDADVVLGAAVPDVQSAGLRDISGFARSLGPNAH
jgi:acetyl esterase